jgi:hypothetical protein
MPQFNFFNQAVEYALGIVGDQTSLSTLVREAGKYVTYETLEKNTRPETTACNVRTKWRKEHGIERDARTHKDIPRRNMFNDNKVKLALLGKLQPVLEAVGADTFTEIIAGFHSIDQLRNAITHIGQLAPHYDLVNV